MKPEPDVLAAFADAKLITSWIDPQSGMKSHVLTAQWRHFNNRSTM